MRNLPKVKVAQATAALLRTGDKRLFWPGLAGGIVVALTIQFIFMILAVPDASSVRVTAPVNGTSAMFCASIAGFAAAATTALLTRHVLERHVALNAYLSWAAANLILIVNVALTTNALA